MTCPACGGGSRRTLQTRGYWLRDCGTCGHRFCELETGPDHPRRVYDDAYFEKGGAGYPGYLTEADLLIAHGRRYGRLLRRFARPGRILDVGSAAGFILKGLHDAGWHGEGIEPNARMVDHARRVLGLRVHRATLEGFEAEGTFEAVTMVQALAHLFDLRDGVSRVARALVPGGVLLVETADRDSFVARLMGSR